MNEIITQMLMIDPVVLLAITVSTGIITTGLTGTLKMHGWNKLYVMIAVYTALLLAYVFRDNEIVRWITTYIVGLGWASGGYNIIRKPKGVQDNITGGQTPVDPEFIERDLD